MLRKLYDVLVHIDNNGSSDGLYEGNISREDALIASRDDLCYLSRDEDGVGYLRLTASGESVLADLNKLYYAQAQADDSADLTLDPYYVKVTADPNSFIAEVEKFNAQITGVRAVNDFVVFRIEGDWIDLDNDAWSHASQEAVDFIGLNFDA